MSIPENSAPENVSDAEWERDNPNSIRCRYVWADGYRCCGEISEIQEIKPPSAWKHTRGRWYDGPATPFYKFVCSDYGHHDGADAMGENGTVFPREKIPAPVSEAMLASITSNRKAVR